MVVALFFLLYSRHYRYKEETTMMTTPRKGKRKKNNSLIEKKRARVCVRERRGEKKIKNNLCLFGYLFIDFVEWQLKIHGLKV